jgi:uncharacterized protein (TIGR03083 family)
MSEDNAVYVDEYRAVRGRVRDVLSGFASADFDRTAPATPEWRVRDVLAHVVGVVDDALHGRLDGVTTIAWTSAQVDARRDRAVPEMLDEWDTLAPAFEEALLQLPPMVTGQVLADATTHEHDVRHALGAAGARDAAAITLMFDWMIEARTLGGAQPLAFECDGTVHVGGQGDPLATVRASRFEFVRAMTGRRSASEIEQYDWSSPVDPATILVAPSLFTLRAEPLNE